MRGRPAREAGTSPSESRFVDPIGATVIVPDLTPPVTGGSVVRGPSCCGARGREVGVATDCDSQSIAESGASAAADVGNMQKLRSSSPGLLTHVQFNRLAHFIPLGRKIAQIGICHKSKKCEQNERHQGLEDAKHRVCQSVVIFLIDAPGPPCIRTVVAVGTPACSDDYIWLFVGLHAIQGRKFAGRRNVARKSEEWAETHAAFAIRWREWTGRIGQN